MLPLPRLLFAAALTLSAPARAFCGFHVARADGELFNKASTVVYSRVDDTPVITMSSDYCGNPAEFAMIVLTPTVLDRGQVTTVPSATMAQVNLSRHSAEARQELEPSQLTYRSKGFMLPIQLGKLDGDGPQDLIVPALNKEGRTVRTNDQTKDIPSDVNVPIFVSQVFPQVYRAMFDRAAGDNGACLEYAWDMAEAATPDIFVTRLHIRYSPTSFFEDLKFAVTGDRENFQGSHILNHPFEGEITCAKGKTYVSDTRQRIKEEATLLRKLTGWSAATIASNIAKTVRKRYR